MRGAFLLLALLAFLPALFHCSPLFVLTAPNILRVENEENIVVESYHSNQDLNVEIRLSFFTKTYTIFRTEGRLSSTNNYLISVPVQIPREKVRQESSLPQYVLLEAQSSVFHLERVILISYQLGHIFIQTDKPIYTPTQTVNYRLLTVDNDMKPIRTSALVDFVNPQGVIVKRTPAIGRTSGIIGQTFPIPKITNIGIWKIAVSFKEVSHVNYTTEFEVKEYVLPSFEVALESKQKFFYVDDTKLDVSITARFTYGKPVEGRAFVMFGIMKDGERIAIPSSLQSVAMGRGAASLTSRDLNASFPNIYEFVGCSIYIAVSVITHSGSDMVEAEKTGIKIVTSPYTISFTKTSKYYKPGMPFDLVVQVTNPDGSPASGIPMMTKDGKYTSRTEANGHARVSINTGGQASNIPIEVVTNVANIPKDRQASASMMAQPYRTQYGSKNYLHISIQQTELDPGKDLPVQLNLRNDDAATQNQIKYFTYMIISKGKIVKVGQQPRQQDQIITIMKILVTPDLIPSFRLLVYYYLSRGSATEMVADSIWVDVKDTCMGTLIVSNANEDEENKIYKPRNQFRLKITGDSGATVGLGAVDKAVFVLNKKHKLTQSKIWDVVEKNDIGCTPGSGSDVLGVFIDAGLTIVTSTDLKTPTRTELKCQQPTKRKRRSTRLMDVKAAKLQQYSSQTQRICCKDGMMSNPMGFSCDRRAKKITLSEECKAVFLDCCNRIQAFKDLQRRSQLTLARSDDDDYYSPYDEIIARTDFPETWLWIQRTLPTNDQTGVDSIIVPGILKDSITTWEIQAVSVSPTKGICVAEPYKLVVQKEFFIDLRLPYSVVRNEQVEIRAILYNYGTEDIKVRVEFPYNEKFCSSAKPSQRFRQYVDIPAKGSTAIPYIIVPLEIGQINVEVKASVYDRLVTDGVNKPLRVLPDGKEIDLPLQSYELDPQGSEQKLEVDIKSPSDILPKTEVTHSSVSKGDILAQTIENSIDGAKLRHLISAPWGCGEQNMINLTPGVLVTKFLDKTMQWERVGIDKRGISLNYIEQGYARQLTYRKTDGSYAAYLSEPSSTWLTAYVLKVVAMAQDLITIDARRVCEAAKWLIYNKQLLDGHFKEDAPVLYLKTMTGELGGSENDASLTAFVLIAMFKADAICSPFVENYKDSITKAAEYLKNRIDNLKRAYSVAITAYALSLLNINKLNTLMRFASGEQSYWTDTSKDNFFYTVETTGYSLLTLVQFKEFDKAGKLVKWLSRRSEFEGGYRSTQVTMVVLQALTDYQANVPQEKEIDLDVVVSIPGRALPVPWRFSSANRYVTKTEEMKNIGKFTVKAKGKGQGTLKVLTRYYAQLSKVAKECKNFDLHITVGEVPQAKRPQHALNSLEINIFTRFLGDSDSTMAIIDISMLTGFTPDVDDLNSLQNGVDRYISSYELDKSLSTQGSLIIYLNSVSHTEDTQLGFKVHQFYRVGLIQPASVKVYEYYNDENSCSKFYNVNESSAMLSKICEGDVCKCVEVVCQLKCRPIESVTETVVKKSCQHEIDYVYKIRFHKKEKRDNYIIYEITVLLVIKQGTDDVVAEQDRELITHANCEEIFNVELENDYLLMGQLSDLWKDGERVRYVVGHGSWIEWWPNNGQCQNRQNARLCQDLEEFRETLMVNGCDY